MAYTTKVDFLESIDSNLKNRFNASIDIGFDPSDGATPQHCGVVDHANPHTALDCTISYPADGDDIRIHSDLLSNQGCQNLMEYVEYQRFRRQGFFYRSSKGSCPFR